MTTKTYISHYGSFWSFTPKAFIAFVDSVIKNDGAYDLNIEGKRLSGRPAHIHKNEGSAGFWSARDDYYETLDWNVEAFIALRYKLAQKAS